MTIPTPPRDYHHHQGEALALLRDCAVPNNDRDRVRLANVHAALALAAVVDEFYAAWNRPVDIELTDVVSGTAAELRVPGHAFGDYVFEPVAHGLPPILETPDALEDVLQAINETGAYQVSLPIIDSAGRWWMAYEYEVGGDDVAFAVENNDPALRVHDRGDDEPWYPPVGLDKVTFPAWIIAAPNND